VYSQANSAREYFTSVLDKNQSNNYNNVSVNMSQNNLNEENYQVLNKKYFQMISYLQKELCKKEMEIYSLLQENIALKKKLMNNKD